MKSSENGWVKNRISVGERFIFKWLFENYDVGPSIHNHEFQTRWWWPIGFSKRNVRANKDAALIQVCKNHYNDSKNHSELFISLKYIIQIRNQLQHFSKGKILLKASDEKNRNILCYRGFVLKQRGSLSRITHNRIILNHTWYNSHQT